MTDQELAAEIRRRMEARHISDKGMSGVTAIARTTLVRKLAGVGTFDIQELLRICAALNCSPDELLPLAS